MNDTPSLILLLSIMILAMTPIMFVIIDRSFGITESGKEYQAKNTAWWENYYELNDVKEAGWHNLDCEELNYWLDQSMAEQYYNDILRIIEIKECELI